MMKDLECLSYKERLRESVTAQRGEGKAGLFSQETRRLRGISSLKGWCEEAEPGSCQWHPVPGPEALVTNWNMEGSL